MLRNWFSDFCVISLIAVSMMFTGAAIAEINGTLVKQIQTNIVQVRTAEDTSVARDAAERLAQLTEKVKPQNVTDEMLAELASLLNCSDDAVRFWVAASLGNLGPRARSTVPKLLDVLQEVDCLNGAMTSAEAIRYALVRIGVKPPPRPDCTRIAG